MVAVVLEYRKIVKDWGGYSGNSEGYGKWVGFRRDMGEIVKGFGGLVKDMEDSEGYGLDSEGI